MIPVVLSGGSGTRLWPLSRASRPKQFLPLVDQFTMFQNTLKRLEGVADLADPMVVCNQDHRFIVAEQLQQLGLGHHGILLEPFGRNTAPAVAIAALQAVEHHDDPLLLILPADHVITNPAAFHKALVAATELASKGNLVTFGIVPTGPETGYGYIQASDPIGSNGFSVNAFVEKPDLETAQTYVDSGDFYWNSGMFLFRASVYLEQLALHRSEMIPSCKEALRSAAVDLDFIRLGAEAFGECPDDSIDYAVMEKTDKAVVVPLDAGWSDVGAWAALWQVNSQDKQQNALHGDVIALDSQRCLAMAESGRLVSLLGVEDLVVVDTPDAILVAHREKAQEVKKIVDKLKSNKRSEALEHREVYRPWGKYDSIDCGDRFQVKRITVNPGGKLSLQKHHHRAEHWIVVSGTAEVLCGDKSQLLTENQSTYIPLGAVHQLRNPGKLPLEMIEVQSGSYLGEDDIVRLEDIYGRVK